MDPETDYEDMDDLALYEHIEWSQHIEWSLVENEKEREDLYTFYSD